MRPIGRAVQGRPLRVGPTPASPRCCALRVSVAFAPLRVKTDQVGYRDNTTMSKVSIIREFWEFLKVRKKFWLAPIVVILLLLGAILVAVGGNPLAPFIYALF